MNDDQYFRFAIILLKKQAHALLPGQSNMKIKMKVQDNIRNGDEDKCVNAALVHELDEEYRKIEKYSLIVFPILFFMFNIIYWPVYIA